VKSGQNVYGYLESMKNLIIGQNLSSTAWCWHSAWKPKMFNDGWLSLNSYGSLIKDFLNYPDKVKERLKADAEKKQQLAEAAQQALEKKVDNNNKANEFKLRIKDYINHGADANSTKFSKKERQDILASFVSVFGHEPADENEWQDLMRINNGYWPSKTSRTAEEKAKEDFKKIFKRAPNLNVNNDKHTVKILAYDIHQRPEQRSLGKERKAIVKFKKIFKHLPASSADWKFIHALAYGGVNN
jgi:hypothetical protein